MIYTHWLGYHNYNFFYLFAVFIIWLTNFRSLITMNASLTSLNDSCFNEYVYNLNFIIIVIIIFSMTFHWILAIIRHWLGHWLCAEQATSHHLNQCRPSYAWMHYSTSITEIYHAPFIKCGIISKASRICNFWNYWNVLFVFNGILPAYQMST